jgi:hypothetical protein
VKIALILLVCLPLPLLAQTFTLSPFQNGLLNVNGIDTLGPNTPRTGITNNDMGHLVSQVRSVSEGELIVRYTGLPDDSLWPAGMRINRVIYIFDTYGDWQTFTVNEYQAGQPPPNGQQTWNSVPGPSVKTPVSVLPIGLGFDNGIHPHLVSVNGAGQGQFWRDQLGFSFVTLVYSRAQTGVATRISVPTVRVVAYAYGDANFDGKVGFVDYLILAANYGLPGDWEQGDFSGDGLVGLEDFLLLALNYDQGPLGGGSPPPPEP